MSMGGGEPTEAIGIINSAVFEALRRDMRRRTQQQIYVSVGLFVVVGSLAWGMSLLLGESRVRADIEPTFVPTVETVDLEESSGRPDP